VIATSILAELFITLYQVVLYPAVVRINELSFQGTFSNSGLFSCYLVATLPAVWYFRARNVSHKLAWSFFYGLNIALIVLVLTITKSRAAMLSLILLLGLLHIEVIKGLLGQFSDQIKKGILCTIALVLISMFAVLIFWKSASSTGRLLIWTISFKHALFKPFTGYGYGSFASLYPHWQGEYFGTNSKLSPYAKVADFSYVCFNEPLQLFTETGIIGLVAFSAFLFSIYKILPIKIRSVEVRAFTAIISAILVFSLFSYPLHSPAMLFLFIGCTAMLANLNERRLSVFTVPSTVNVITQFIMIAISFLGTILFCQQYTAVIKWETSKNTAYDGDNDALYPYNSIYPVLQHSGPFLLDYAEKLSIAGLYTKSTEILGETHQFMISERSLLMMGENYESIKNNQLAIRTYKELSSIVPNRFTPRARLARLYLATGDTVQAKEMARTILSMPVKILSDDIFQIKADMRFLLKNTP
jgi:hypothetical protein